MNAKIIKKYIERFLPYIFVFIAGLYRPYDADLGWHLKYGEYFFKYGNILRDNTFSTMMPDFKWANTSWGVDLISYSAYHALGFLGITLLGALVITLIFLFFAEAFELNYWEKALIFPAMLFIENAVNEVSFRGQLLSILLLGILFFLIEKYTKTKSRIIFFVVPLFLFWANVEGQFVLGLGIFVIWLFAYGFSQIFQNRENLSRVKPEAKTLLIVLILTLLATLVDPFGIGIYIDAFLHFGNPHLKDIAEYLPFRMFSQGWWNQLIMGILVGLGIIFLYFENSLKKRIPFIGITLVLYSFAWFVRRYAWSLYYLAIPFLKPVVSFFVPPKKYVFISATILFSAYILITIYVKAPFTQFSNMSWQTYCSYYGSCSFKAADFIVKNHLNNNKLMTLYDWGGWLIWNYPQIKPSIDGRMHLWIDEKGYSGFADYYGYEQNFKNVDNSKYDTILMSPGKALYSQLISLVKIGKWKLIYQDQFAGVFVRNKSSK